ncbi:MAG: OB-fold nucleic acid binding domain-containing protein [Candidatus Woesearchaeota archaeon]
MKINELTAKAAVPEIVVTVKEKGTAREVRGGSLQVCDCIVQDESGEVTLTLWNDDIERVDVGDTLTIQKGWVNEYQGKLQLSVGRFGQLDIKKAEKQAVDKEVLDAMDDEII